MSEELLLPEYLRRYILLSLCPKFQDKQYSRIPDTRFRNSRLRFFAITHRNVPGLLAVSHPSTERYALPVYDIAVERLIIDISVYPQIEFSGKASFYRFVFKPFPLVFPLHGHFVIKYSGIFVCRRNTYR